MDASRQLNGRESGPSPDGAERAASGILAHLDSAYNLATWLLRDEHHAQDIVQEAYIRATNSRATFRGGDERAWLLAIVRNACFDFLRRRKISPFDDLGDEMEASAISAEIDPAQILERAEDVQRVRNAIDQLPAGIREVVILREMEGLSYKEIAGVVGVPMGTVMSRLARARQQLAKLLGNECRSTAKGAED